MRVRIGLGRDPPADMPLLRATLKSDAVPVREKSAGILQSIVSLWRAMLLSWLTQISTTVIPKASGVRPL